MKQFNLEKYNHLVSEGRTPRLVTREGLDVRILCTDKMDMGYPIVALVMENKGETAMVYGADGKRKYYPDNTYDLFFADLEPTYRPYKDAEEFLEAQKEHGSYLLACGQNHLPSLVDDRCIVTVSTSGAKAWTYSVVLDIFVWRDKSPCGVKEEEV